MDIRDTHKSFSYHGFLALQLSKTGSKVNMESISQAKPTEMNYGNKDGYLETRAHEQAIALRKRLPVGIKGLIADRRM